jgi:hypothetical protein
VQYLVGAVFVILLLIILPWLLVLLKALAAGLCAFLAIAGGMLPSQPTPILTLPSPPTIVAPMPPFQAPAVPTTAPTAVPTAMPPAVPSVGEQRILEELTAAQQRQDAKDKGQDDKIASLSTQVQRVQNRLEDLIPRPTATPMQPGPTPCNCLSPVQRGRPR